jgi:hypothetical protein
MTFSSGHAPHVFVVRRQSVEARFIGAAKMSCASARMFSIQPDCCSFHHDKMKTAGSRFVPGNRGIKQALPNE